MRVKRKLSTLHTKRREDENMDILNKLTNIIMHDKILLLVVIAIIFDTILGTLRAFRERKLNSSIGINGIIRKTSTLISIIALVAVDAILNLNFISFVPKDITAAIGIEKIGLCEFFSLLFIMYEIISILKNWTLCGIWLPKKLKNAITSWLENMTGELPNN